MHIVMSILSELRNRIPLITACGFSIIGLLACGKFQLDISSASISGAVIGYIVGMIVKSLVPDPNNKAL